MSSDPHSDPNSVELPTPTAWPIISAFGMTLLFAGLVTNLIVSLAGLVISLIGSIGWFRDVFPHPRHEPVPVRKPDAHPQPIRVEGRKVQMLAVGEDGHRMHVPEEIHPYRAGVFGGLAGGLAMAIVACGYGILFKASVWFPINLLAAAAVPDLALATPAQLAEFSVIGLIVATISHVSISILVGLLYVVILPMLPQKWEWLVGGIFAPLVWSGFLLLSLGMISPALAANIDLTAFFLSQLIFGVVCGYVVFHSGKVRTQQSWPVSRRLGVEAQHREESK